MPAYLHLGDIINIVQYNNYHDRELFAETICKCCGNSGSLTTKFIIKLIDANITYTEDSVGAKISTPTWMTGFRITYKKAVISCDKRNDNIVVSFSTRSASHCYRRKFIKDLQINQLLETINQSVINIGDKEINHPLVVNHCHDSLQEKFNLINNAKKCYTIDNGIAHLSALTETPTTVIYPEWRNPECFMPICNNIDYLKINCSFF